MLLNIATVFVLLLASIILVCLLIEKDALTKILLLNSSTSMISLFICLLGTYKVNSSYIDIAIIYFILGVVGSVAYLKYFLQEKRLTDE
ncbi:MAG TPA: monovalent cation/H+ antiporter complex subunit F [Candidatus Megaira endosymbiont of Nemacystus decipiens]|nr:monovalent cation/H+ antiporter complex subunit F [Candidatus Megaera endosymbiont of Nemacystus decipiens]